MIDSQRMEGIIRYWVILEELKRQKEMVFEDDTLHRSVVHFNPETQEVIKPVCRPQR